MILSDDDEGEQVLERSLSQKLDSLLGSKSTFTPKWADSVRMIMGSAGSVSPRTNCSTNTSSPSVMSSDGDHGQHDRHSCLDREITELEGADKFFSSVSRTFKLQPTFLRMTTPFSIHKDVLHLHFKTFKQALTKLRHGVFTSERSECLRLGAWYCRWVAYVANGLGSVELPPAWLIESHVGLERLTFATHLTFNLVLHKNMWSCESLRLCTCNYTLHVQMQQLYFHNFSKLRKQRHVSGISIKSLLKYMSQEIQQANRLHETESLDHCQSGCNWHAFGMSCRKHKSVLSSAANAIYWETCTGGATDNTWCRHSANSNRKKIFSVWQGLSPKLCAR